MYHKCLGLEQAYDFLKARRSVIAPNLNFMHQLVQFEEELARKRKREEDSTSGLAEADIDVTVEAPTPKTSRLSRPHTDPCSAGPCGFIFSFDSPLTPLVSPTPSFANCSPLVSPSWLLASSDESPDKTGDDETQWRFHVINRR